MPKTQASSMTAHQTIEAQQDTLTGAEIIVRALLDQGVEVLFGYPGGAVLPIYDALYAEPRLRHILVRHEQGATHAAEGYATCYLGSWQDVFQNDIYAMWQRAHLEHSKQPHPTARSA